MYVPLLRTLALLRVSVAAFLYSEPQVPSLHEYARFSYQKPQAFLTTRDWARNLDTRCVLETSLVRTR